LDFLYFAVTKQWHGIFLDNKYKMLENLFKHRATPCNKTVQVVDRSFVVVVASGIELKYIVVSTRYGL